MTKSSDSRVAKKLQDKLSPAQQALLGDVKKVRSSVDSTKLAVQVFKKSFEQMQENYNCLQFQLMIQDFESILNHIDSLETDGPLTPHKDVPLEDSVMDAEGDDEGATVTEIPVK